MKLDRYDIALVNASSKNDRPSLANIVIRKGQLMAADGFMLAVRDADITPEEKTDKDQMLPATMLKQIKVSPKKQANVKLTDNRAIVSFATEKNEPLEYEPEMSFKTGTTVFPDVSQLINKEPVKKKAVICLDVGLIKKLVATLPNDGHLRIGITEVTSPIEFQCDNMDRPIRGLLMPMYVDWESFTWHRDAEDKKVA